MCVVLLTSCLLYFPNVLERKGKNTFYNRETEREIEELATKSVLLQRYKMNNEEEYEEEEEEDKLEQMKVEYEERNEEEDMEK